MPGQSWPASVAQWSQSCWAFSASRAASSRQVEERSFQRAQRQVRIRPWPGATAWQYCQMSPAQALAICWARLSTDWISCWQALASPLQRVLRQVSTRPSPMGIPAQNRWASDRQAESAPAVSGTKRAHAHIAVGDFLLLEELGRVLKDGVTPEEVAAAIKAYLAEIQVARGEDANVAGLLSGALHLGRPMSHYLDQERRLAEVTADRVNAALRAHLDPRRLVVIRAGDFKKK